MNGTERRELDLTRPLLTDAERDQYRHLNSQYGLALAMGLRNKPVWPGTYDEAAYRKRRTRNRLARRSRAINRRRAR